MINICVLAVLTGLSFWLQKKIFSYTRNYVLLLPVLTIYYWSIIGGWVVTIDLMTGNFMEHIGFHYYSYFSKLFPIQLNISYTLSLVWFAVFLLSFQVSLLYMVRKIAKDDAKVSSQPIYINHWIIMGLACVLAIISYFFIRAQIIEAMQFKESLYLFLSHQSGRFYSLYQITKSASLFLILFGVSLLLSQKGGKYFTGKFSIAIIIGYTLLGLILFIYATLIGSRSDLLFAFLFAIVFYLINASNISIYRLASLVLSLVLVVAVVEMTRTIPIMNYLGLSVGPGIPSDEVLNRLSIMSTLLSLMASNEMFAGHMSMYGVVYYDVPLTFGGSFNYLLHSLVPRFLVVDRPQDAYQHYASSIGYNGIQGFTINQAAGWYVNFGVPGIVLGGTLLGTLMGYGQSLLRRVYDGRLVVRIFRVMFLLTICAFFPSLIRTGPEGFKALAFEGLLIPFILIVTVSYFSGIVNRRDGKDK
jgi:hypothetical protein